MIAKQSKAFPISNKTQEKSIKNTKVPLAQASSSVSGLANKEESNKPKEPLPRPHFAQPTQKKQNQPNETRSEIKPIERSLPVATSTPGSESSSPSPSPSQAPMALQASGATNATTSLLSASTKIQQRQQKFLAAAAKSATSPQSYHLQRHQSQAGPLQPKVTLVRLEGSRSVCESAYGCACTSTCCSTFFGSACCKADASQRNCRSFPALNQQLASARCCPNVKIAPLPASNKSVASANCTSQHHHHHQCQHSGVTCKSNVEAAKLVSSGRAKTMGVADGRVCDKASDRAMSGDMSKRERPLQQLPQAQAAIGAADGNAYGPIDCGPADAKIARSAGEAAEAAAVEPVGGVVNESSPVAAINCADTCRAVVAEQRLNADGNESGCEYRHQPQQLSHHHHHQHHLHHLHHHHHLNHHHNHQLKHQQQQQQHPQQQHHHHHHQSGNQQAEVRRLCQNNEFKDEKDKININHQKNTFKQQQHFHHNHNNQHVYPQLQYEPAQQILTANTPHNQSTPISTPPQPPQQVMAHYKFHNDCQSSVLTYEQVKRLDFVMDQVVPVHGRGNAPTLYVKLKELIRSVKHKLHEHSIEIRDVRLNGGASNYVLAPENSHYNDLDLILGTDLSNEDRFDVIRDVVLECLMEFYPKELHQQMEDQEGEEEGGEEEGEKKQGGHVSGASSMANSEGAKQEVEMANDEMHTENSSSRSDRSSSFESDNLNITNNELDVPSEEEQEDDDDDDDDEEDNIIVTIDSDDDFCIKKPAASGPEVTSTTAPEPNFGRPVEGPSGDSEEAAETIAEASSCASHQVDTQAVHYQHLQMPPNKSAIKEAYVHKMVKVNDDDRWSLISLGVQPSETNNYNLMQQHQSAEGAEGVPLCCVQAQSEGSATSRKNQQSIRACQQSQLPNSIELKFVDRMRRKFEFSVDSFQIILDSLIQFYDYAPQSTITIQRTPSSFMNSIIGRRASCGQCCGLRMIQQGTLDRNCGEKEIDKFLDNTNESSMMKKKKKKQQQQQPQNSKQSNNNNKDASLNASRAFYDLPLEPNLSNSSVASSSGCSSSSSVVSSSSSSLSCDEDHEDLDCDVDSSPSSSSASTSSLLSATTAASLSMSSGADQLCDPRAQLETIDGVSSPPAASMGAGEHETAAERDQRRAQKLTTQSAKQAKEGSSKNDCAGSESRKCMQTECDIETSKLSSCAVISENFYPTVIGRSEYGNFKEALYHLEKKLIATRSPEEIRGGGLLKYCNLLVKNYKPTNVLQIRTLERYMCSRFFIDFSDLNQQRAKLESYLANHFSDDPMQKYHYLTILHNVVQRSTVCLMNHELRLTLNMIRELAYELNEQHQQLQSSQSLHQSQQAQRRAALCEQQPLFSQPQPQPQPQSQPQSQSRQKVDQPEAQYQQQAKQTVMQSGVYRVKLVNYALAKPIKS